MPTPSGSEFRSFSNHREALRARSGYEAMRRIKHGPIQPMEEPNWLTRVLGRR